MGAVSVLSPVAIVRQLLEGADSSTLLRLGRSRHVADLRLIFSVTLIIMLLSVVLSLVFCFEHEGMLATGDGKANVWALVFAAIVDSGPFIGAIGAVGCGVLAWTYQTGSARLGVVDLFACEIATLCRVSAVVEMVQRYVQMFEHGSHPPRSRSDQGDNPGGKTSFSSEESYFPVFESSVKDLQALEVDVVKNVTAFYTYMKVTRDTLRKLASIEPPNGNGTRHDEWHQVVCNVVYMQFLGLESARKAIKDLVEFEPKQAEDMATILLSELPAYGFLRRQFRGDVRQKRLDARDPDYRKLVCDLNKLVEDAEGVAWAPAKDIAVEMMKRFAHVFPEHATQRTREPAFA